MKDEGSDKKVLLVNMTEANPGLIWGCCKILQKKLIIEMI